MPSGLQFTNGNTTSYVYDASGQKLSVTHQTAIAGVVIPMTNVMTPLTTAQISQTFKTDYCGNVIYENGVISKILTEEGYITLSGTTPTYHYYLKDHQGNNRVVINQSGTVEQVNHYYAFGGLFGEGIQTSNQPYKYNGKELDRMHGLDLFDYGARHYDGALGRWGSIDPLAEKYYSISPYVYVGNNPVRFVDPDGRNLDDIVIREKEKLITIIKQNENVDRIYDKDNPKGLEIEKGSFDFERYKNDGYKVESVTPTGMGAADLALSILGGEVAFAKIGAWIGKGISSLKAGQTAKAVEASVEVGANAAKGVTSNPFKERTFSQIDEMFKAKGFTTKGVDPLSGKGSYFSPSGTRYYFDKGGMYKKGFEGPHVDIWYKGHPSFEKVKYFLDGSPKMYTPLK